MLTENDVVDAVSAFLKSKGFVIDQSLTTSQKGIDIVATHPTKGQCYIEAKGATSSKTGSSRHGKVFNNNQIKTHVGVALLKSFQTMQNHKNAEVAIALPNDPGHMQVINSIRDPIKRCGIKVYLVDDNLSVQQYL